MGDMLQFPGNDMTPPELPDEDWWSDETRDPPVVDVDDEDDDASICDCGADHTLPEPTAEEVMAQDAHHWDQIPGVVRGFLAGIQRAERIAVLSGPGSYIHRQSLVTVRRRIPVIREWLLQLEEALGQDSEAEESLRENLVVAGFEVEEVDRSVPMTQEEARRILANHDTGLDRLHLPLPPLPPPSA
jgi:hypothetical protein